MSTHRVYELSNLIILTRPFCTPFPLCHCSPPAPPPVACVTRPTRTEFRESVACPLLSLEWTRWISLARGSPDAGGPPREDQKCSVGFPIVVGLTLLDERNTTYSQTLGDTLSDIICVDCSMVKRGSHRSEPHRSQRISHQFSGGDVLVETHGQIR